MRAWFRKIPIAERETAAKRAGLTDQDFIELNYEWEFLGRDNQLWPLSAWTIWLILAGRGFGKTRTGAEWVIRVAYLNPRARIALLGETAADVRDTMVSGDAGILACSPTWFRPVYSPSTRSLKWPNGAQATTFSAETPDQLRGPAHSAAWVDELAKFKYADAWDQLMFGLRLGNNPQVCVTTTPRPTKQIKDISAAKGTVITRGTTYDNRPNLAENFFTTILAKFENTRLGRQELLAELLDDVPGALWNLEQLDALRRHPENIAGVVEYKKDPIGSLASHMQRIVVAIDPAVTSGENSDETGIVVCALGDDGHGYVLEDLSGRYAPNKWAEIAISAYKRWNADMIVAEVNNGGDLVENTIRAIDENVPYRKVHASRGKVTRAEPIAQLYERRRMHHIGTFATLEDQMSAMTVDFDAKKAGGSPDRLDALVWGFTFLFFDAKDKAVLEHYRAEHAKSAGQRALDLTKVLMRAPASMVNSTFHDRKGAAHQIGVDRLVWIARADVAAMRKSGFVEVVNDDEIAAGE